jgi:nucleotide-binding universal stress UspA family protein
VKILATFDGSVFAESIIPRLRVIAGIPGAELILLRVAGIPHGRLAVEPHPPVGAAPAAAGATPVVLDQPEFGFAETKEQAVERATDELIGYLQGVAAQMPAEVPCAVEVILDDDPKSAIVKFALTSRVDLIVMATHGRTGLVHVLFGDVAESVLRSGVAPVLLVHPQDVARSRQSANPV